eukprot:CAMPEP_0194508756 /NCGR_PEP_ID=MMETSP0253-20130528/39100_1 /TAXON_ID=2966 /ORGANISM="Noctiluca scintillans" /LENGTH=150 /DNA_ID=CAMNT_0039351827 /DNA_START=63 /DNA_END=513 /DNA_ORIENTATION=-
MSSTVPPVTEFAATRGGERRDASRDGAADREDSITELIERIGEREKARIWKLVAEETQRLNGLIVAQVDRFGGRVLGDAHPDALWTLNCEKLCSPEKGRKWQKQLIRDEAEGPFNSSRGRRTFQAARCLHGPPCWRETVRGGPSCHHHKR